MSSLNSDSNKSVELVSLKNISKRFGPVTALNDVSLSLKSGEIHALLGENGAGKSTLMNILFGAFPATDGSIAIEGVDVTENWSTQKAIKCGIGMIHQHFSLVNEHTVLENVVMPALSFKSYSIDWQAHKKRLSELCNEFNIAVPIQATVSDLTVGERQQVEILKMLYQGARVLILDEPTSVLTPQQAESLFKMLIGFRNQGYAVVIITHKLEDAMRLCDQITILRNGHAVTTVRPKDTNVNELAHKMVPETVGDVVRQSTVSATAPIVLNVKNMLVSGNDGVAVNKVSFALRSGEILGIAGVAGNGQSELAQALLGLKPTAAGQVILDDVDITNYSSKQRRQAGLAFVPEDRHAMGMVANMDVASNMILNCIDNKKFSNLGIVNKQSVFKNAQESIRAFKIRVHSPHTLMGTLSGGNQQKVVLSREFAADPKALIISEPARGLDFASSAYVREQLLSNAESGLGVLLFSSDLEELMTLSHRIMVMYQGQFVGELNANEYNLDAIGLMMAGVRDVAA